MVKAKWLRYEPRGITPEGLEILRGLARGLVPLSEIPDLGERAELAERERARARNAMGTSTCVRAVVAYHILVDLVKQGWSVKAPRGLINIQRRLKLESLDDERNYVRQQLQTERDEQLREPAAIEFVNEMETRRFHERRSCSIFSLMRDGRDLGKAIDEAHQSSQWDAAVRPYLQFVREDEVCKFTGFRLVDIWRYFRHTWANPYKSVPGRTMMIVVRDAAAPFHPVMGIAALSSATVGLTVRDEFIGWTIDRVQKHILEAPSKKHLDWMMKVVDEAIKEIYVDDLMRDGTITIQSLKQPNEILISELSALSDLHRQEHYRLMQGSDYKAPNKAAMAKVGYWLKQAETLLFKAKREEELSALLGVRLRLSAALGAMPTPRALGEFIGTSVGRDTLARVVRRVKSDRVGNAIADLTVCGAVAPYNELLGGKLVAMLMGSPEVRDEYHRRYSKTPSIIASSMAGKAVQRPVELVFISTTSLYGQRPNQYDRIAIPGRVWGGDGEMRYEYLGRTEGKGTYQFNAETMKAMGRMLEQTRGGQRVNYVFGEGVNPRLRHLRDGLDELGLPAGELLQHGTPRLVYVLNLIENLAGFLLGWEKRPKWISGNGERTGIEASAMIAEWWRERWMKGRLSNEEAMGRVREHTLLYPVTHGARVVLPRTVGAQGEMF